MSQFTKDDVELAERYVNLLHEIEELLYRKEWNEQDFELVERHAAVLQEIEERYN